MATRASNFKYGETSYKPINFKKEYFQLFCAPCKFHSKGWRAQRAVCRPHSEFCKRQQQAEVQG